MIQSEKGPGRRGSKLI
uniref:Uncharacterized protein n=1 Tax=Anguilla anguilla TaxID=7936 RepID=A0A0E9SME6_ANGAN